MIYLCPFIFLPTVYLVCNHLFKVHVAYAYLRNLPQGNRWPTEPVHRGFVFTPSLQHLGFRVRLIVRPRDASGQLGIPYGNLNYWRDNGEPVDCQWPIERGPAQKYVEERLATVTRQPKDDQFRVVSYNLLADMYSSTDSAQNLIFRHCPLLCLSQKYRLPLILRELTAYQPDLLCLQEVDKCTFQSWLKPVLKYVLGMDGIFLSKRKIIQHPEAPAGLLPTNEEKGEGCVVFYRTSRFSLIREYHLPSILSYTTTTDEIQKRLERIETALTSISEASLPGFEMHGQKAAAHCLVAALFRLNGQCRPDHSLLLVGNSHFYFHPDATHWRVKQACGVRAYLETVAAEATQEFGCPVSLVFCGDLNASPDTLVYATLVGDAGDTTAPLGQLQSAYSQSDAAFTNWVPDFYSVLDYVLYSTTYGLRCHQKLPLCSIQRINELLQEADLATPITPRGPPVADHDIFALPNSEFPSDHLSLVVDFCWDTSQEEE